MNKPNPWKKQIDFLINKYGKAGTAKRLNLTEKSLYNYQAANSVPHKRTQLLIEDEYMKLTGKVPREIGWDVPKVAEEVNKGNKVEEESVPYGPVTTVPPKAWEYLSESILHLSQGIRKGQENIGSLTNLLNPNTSSGDLSSMMLTSDLSFGEFLERLADVLAGKSLSDTQILQKANSILQPPPEPVKKEKKTEGGVPSKVD
jgi:hypothetical protein